MDIKLNSKIKNKLIQKLFDQPLDIIGDVHGEIDALQSLLAQLGYDENGHHPDNRKLVFIGDLCDRGVDSISVLALVKHLIDQGNAQCILGNHELNLLINSKREGNGWFFGSPHEDDQKSFNSRPATQDDREWILEFLNTLPLVLESDQLRVVHACWNRSSIDALQACSCDSIADVYAYFEQEARNYMQQSGIAAHAQQELTEYQDQLKDPQANVPFLLNLGRKDVLEQMNNPVKVLTSGAETLAEQPFYAGGKWRMVDRHAWWDEYRDDTPVIIGHYWRKIKTNGEKSIFKNIDTLAWFGAKNNVYCVDYSVGKRYLDRARQNQFNDLLAALRMPEKILILEDGSIYPTSSDESMIE